VTFFDQINERINGLRCSGHFNGLEDDTPRRPRRRGRLRAGLPE
jgi:hypothetical protein